MYKELSGPLCVVLAVLILIIVGWMAWKYALAPPQSSAPAATHKEIAQMKYQHRLGAVNIREQQRQRAAELGLSVR